MESDIPMEAVEDVDTESDQVVTGCLGVSLILRNIFQHCSTTELLKLSLVNKLWCYEARSLLRDRGTVTTTINKNKKCQDLVAFASALPRTNEITKVLPLSGLTIHLGCLDCNHRDMPQQAPTSELDQACEYILDQLTWKHLALDFFWEWPQDLTGCPGFLLMQKILHKFGPVLEEFSLGLPMQQGDFFQQVIQGCCSSFPCLKILKIQQFNDPNNNGYTNLIKALVSHSPNLKVLHTSGRVNLRANLLEGSSAVHITDYPYSPFLNEIPEDAGPLCMTRMVLKNISQAVDVERFNGITSGLLKASRTTLNSMHIHALFLAPLTTYGVSFENMRKLEINLEHQKLEIMYPRVLRLIKCFDFTRTFPNLKAVKLNCFSFHDTTIIEPIDGIGDLVEQGNAVFREPLPDRAVHIKNLSLECRWPIEDSTGQFLTEMFPNVESLSITGTEIPIGRFWESLHNLKVLDVHNVNDGSVVKNLDSVFCGIFPEEVAQLREQDEEYLRNVNIVPVMPSIRCLKGLRNLNLIFGESQGPMEPDDQTCLFLKVAGFIAFQRCPGLVVTLITNETRLRLGLSHLRLM